jgi:hypothetical protein
MKGSCIGYAFQLNPNEKCPILNSEIRTILTLDQAELLLDYSIINCYKLISNNIGQFFNYMGDFRQAQFINLCDLVGYNILLSKFKTSLTPIAYNDYDEAIRLIKNNMWTQKYYNINKRLRVCLDALQFGY